MKTLFIVASFLLSIAYINATNDWVDETITTWGNVEGNFTESIHIDSTMKQEFLIYPMVGCTVIARRNQFLRLCIFFIGK